MFDNNVIIFFPCFCFFLGCSYVNFSNRSLAPNTSYRGDDEGGYVFFRLYAYSFHEPNSRLNFLSTRLAFIVLCTSKRTKYKVV